MIGTPYSMRFRSICTIKQFKGSLRGSEWLLQDLADLCQVGDMQKETGRREIKYDAPTKILEIWDSMMAGIYTRYVYGECKLHFYTDESHCVMLGD